MVRSTEGAGDWSVTFLKTVMLTLLLFVVRAPVAQCEPIGTAPHHSGAGYYALDVVREVDPGGQELFGPRFSAGAVDELSKDGQGRAEASVAALLGDDQHIYRAGLGVGVTLFAVKQVIVVPRLGLGLEYRGDPPHAGVAGVFSVGIEVAAWIKRKAEVALLVDRNFGFPSGTRNQFGLAFRWGAKRLPWWPRDNAAEGADTPVQPQ